jgi:signal transduction histidine kinase
VFERFARGKTAGPDTRVSGGTGLGLAIARWAVHLHGGTIDVVDAAPGCTIRVRLPKTAAAKPK